MTAVGHGRRRLMGGERKLCVELPLPSGVGKVWNRRRVVNGPTSAVRLLFAPFQPFVGWPIKIVGSSPIQMNCV
jgi:hypothetical protein